VKFDVVVMNPPYQANIKKEANSKMQASGGHTIWDKFVKMSFTLAKESGYICSVHPPRWRKPEDVLGKIMRDKELLFLRIFNKQQGEDIFGATTRVDWYVLKNCKPEKNHTVEVVFEDSKQTTITVDDFSNLPFFPNFDFDLLLKILVKKGDTACEIIYESSSYHTSKSWMNREKQEKFIYPCVASTGVNGVRYFWSSIADKGLFGVPKIIFGDADTIANSVVDMEGVFAMTPHAMAIPITSKDEGEDIKKALESKMFNYFLRSCRWSNFQIDYKMFKYFRKDFWKEFVSPEKE